LRVHFGLGPAEKISSVEIRWPSGKVENLGDLAADHYYSVLEGAGIVPAQRIRPAPVTGR
jgi:enediyne biosynthesis protein E4